MQSVLVFAWSLLSRHLPVQSFIKEIPEQCVKSVQSQQNTRMTSLTWFCFR